MLYSLPPFLQKKKETLYENTDDNFGYNCLAALHTCRQLNSKMGLRFLVRERGCKFYGCPQLSQQNQKPHGKNKIPHGKTENLTAKPKTSRQKQNTSRQNQNPHGKTKDLTAKPNTSQQKPNTSRRKQIPTAKPKLFCFCREVFGFTVRHFDFAVTVVGHNKIYTKHHTHTVQCTC